MEEFLKRALKKPCKYSLSKFFNENGFLSVFFFLARFIPFDCKGGRNIAGATCLARNGGKGWCFTEPEADGAELGFADKGRERKRAGEEAARAREAGRGAAEHNQQVRVAFG